MRRLPAVLLFAFVESLPAQSATDSLLRAGHGSLNAYYESHELSDARDAYRAFSELLRKLPQNGEAQLGLGLTYAAVEGQQLAPLSLNDATRVTNNNLAVQHLIDAIKHGAPPEKAAHALVVVCLREYDRDRMRKSIEALTYTGSHSDSVTLALSQLYLALGEPILAEQVVGDSSWPPAQRAKGIAQLLQPGKADLGGVTYLTAMAQADSVDIKEFVRDARWLADDDQAAEWKQMRVADLRAALAQFWRRRATKAGIGTPERLAAHFARVQHALREFNYYRQRIAPRGPLTIDPKIDGREYNVDDRAFIYVRYGEPDARIASNDSVPRPPSEIERAPAFCARHPDVPGCLPQPDAARGTLRFPVNQTWVYSNLSDHLLWFDFFLPPTDAHGWTLVADVVRCRGGSLPYSEVWLRDRMQLDPRYGLILTECQQNAGHPAEAVDARRLDFIALPFVKEREKILQTAVLQDNAVPHVKTNTQVAADVLQFAGDGHATELTAVVVFPLADMAAQSGIAEARVTLTVADTLLNTIESIDTVIRVRVPPDASARARVYLRALTHSGGGRVYRIALRDAYGDRTLCIVGDSVDVRALPGTGISLSDVAIVDAEGGSWERAGRTLSLLPRGVPRREFGIYYEIYGLRASSKYTTTVSFDPADEGLAAIVTKLKGTRIVSLRFDESTGSQEQTIRELRHIKSELPSGRYHLILKVASGTEFTETSRLIVIPK